MGSKPNLSGSSLAGLTDKQRETLALVADGRTNKEIAAELGISTSATVQRIESIRARFDGASKAELGRIYREHSDEWACNEITGNSIQVPMPGKTASTHDWDQSTSQMTLSDSFAFEVSPPWTQQRDASLIPEMLNGRNAVAYRWMVVVGLAIGMAALALVLLAVASAVGDML